VRRLSAKPSEVGLSVCGIAGFPVADKPVSQELAYVKRLLPIAPVESPILLCMPGAARFGRPSKPLAIVILGLIIFIVSWIVFSRL
jgi:hypothetical protein